MKHRYLLPLPGQLPCGGPLFGVLSVSDSLALSCFRSGPHRSCSDSVLPRVNLLLFRQGYTVTPVCLANYGWPSKHLRGSVREEERPSQHAWHLCASRSPTCLARPLPRKSAHPRPRAEGLFPVWSSDGLRSSPQGTTLTSVCLLLLPEDPFDSVLCFCGVRGQNPLKGF